MLGSWHLWTNALAGVCRKLHNGPMRPLLQSVGLTPREVEKNNSGLTRDNRRMFQGVVTLYQTIGTILLEHFNKEPAGDADQLASVEEAANSQLELSTDEVPVRPVKKKKERKVMALDKALQLLNSELKAAREELKMAPRTRVRVARSDANVFHQKCHELGERFPRLRPYMDFMLHEGPAIICMWLAIRHGNAASLRACSWAIFQNYCATNNRNYLGSLWASLCFQEQLTPALRNAYDFFQFRSVNGYEYHHQSFDEHQVLVCAAMQC